MRFCWSTLRVNNLEESIRFYTEVIGLEVASRFKVGSGLEIAFLGKSETQVELICDGENRYTNTGDDISWGFEVESLDTTLALLVENGIDVAGGPFQPSPRTRYIFIKDPNGMKIQLVENIA